MSDIEFAEVDIYGSTNLKGRVAELVSSELGGTRSADTILRTIDFESGTTKVFGGFIKDELVSMNAFMRMGFRRGNQALTGFQSGFSATDSNHRGKGYWPKLMAFAEKCLSDTGASFLFGFPNPVSHPLFIKKLNYTSLKLCNRRIACVPLLYDRAFSRVGSSLQSNALHPNFDDNADWKMRANGANSVIVVQEEGGALWGIVRVVRKFGLPVSFLEVGTFDLAPGGSLERLFAAAAKKANVHLLYVSMNPENQFFHLINFEQHGQPVIIKPLAGFDLVGQAVNFFGGMRDTF